jgi:hypothetical protein
VVGKAVGEKGQQNTGWMERWNWREIENGIEGGKGLGLEGEKNNFRGEWIGISGDGKEEKRQKK